MTGTFSRLSPLITGFITTLLFVGAVTATVAAAEETTNGRESVTLSPASQRYQLESGEVKRSSLTVVNDGEVGYDFIVYARPYSMPAGTSTYDTPNFDATPANADVYKWVQFDKTSYRLGPGESRKVDYTLRVPNNAAPGGHYGVLFVETQPTSGQEGTSVARKKKLGSIIYATVAGDIQLQGSIKAVELPFWQSRPPLAVTADVENGGNTDFVHQTRFKVSDLFGNVKLDQTSEHVVLPDTTRSINLGWQEAPWFGFFKVELAQSHLDKEPEVTRGYVLLAPRWLVLVVAISVIAGAVYVLLQRRR